MKRSTTSPDSISRACRTTAVALAIALAPWCAHAAKFAGVVTLVIDGDTVWVRPDGGRPPQPVRLRGIDAPEICQAYGQKSRKALAGLVRHRRVTVTTESKDDYQRALGVLDVGGDDVGEWMVVHGYAWSYRFKGDAGPYARQEAQARGARLGLWRSGRPVSPREFRVKHGNCKGS